MPCDSLILLSFRLSTIGSYFYLQAPADDECMNVTHVNCMQSLNNQCCSNLSLCLRMASLLWVHVVDAVESVVIMELWIYKKMYPMMILKTMILVQKIFFADCRGGSRNSITSKTELFMIIYKGYIIDKASFLGLLLDYLRKSDLLDWFYVKNI